MVVEVQWRNCRLDRGACDLAAGQCSVLINGQVVMRDKVVLGVDEAEIAAASRVAAAKVWQSFHQ